MESSISRHLPLYLKYRPQALDGLIGQSAVSRTLTNAIALNKLTHAYLFTGPRGTGKTSTARILAKSLNCEQGPTAQPCQNCTACVEIREGMSPAVFEIDAASNNSVDDARALIERAPLVAVGGRFKLYIIDECHMLTKEAFNALLKTIEEPPPGVIFVLATTEEHKVPPTIISRCQRLMFRLVSQSELVDYLKDIAQKESIEIEEEALRTIARRSGGGLRDAMGLLDQAGLLSSPENPVRVSDLLGLLGAVQEDVLLSISAGIAGRAGDQVLSSVNKLLMEGREPAVMALELSRHFLNLAKAAYVAANASQSETLKSLIVGSPEYIAGLQSQSRDFDSSELAQIVEQLDRLEQSCRRSTQPAMTLEIGLLSICHRQEIRLVKELAEKVRKLEEQVESGAIIQPRAHVKPVESSRPAPAPAEPRPAPPPPAINIAPPAPVVGTDAPALPEPPPPMPVAQTAQPEPAPSPPARPEPEPSKPAPAPAAAPQKAEAPASESIVNDIDEFWEELMDVLQKASIPAYSLVSMYGFPMAVTEKELTIGATKDGFQKMIEGKAEHIKKACQAVLGKSLAVRVKVVNQPPARTHRSEPRESSDFPSGSSEADAEESEPAVSAPLMRASMSARTNPAPAPASPPVAAAPAVPIPSGEAGLLKEAYKLFEGPGSRQIS